MSTDTTFSAKPNYIWQLPNPLYSKFVLDESNPFSYIFTEVLTAAKDGIVAKRPFVFSHLKHPQKNFFVFYRKEINSLTFDPESTKINQVERIEWMDKDEEDAYAELEAKGADIASEIDETLLEMILGYKK